ncbi:hypothetical protein BJ742DRAFT_817913 [Cladochytrium replicatum]|nr:hypothetical protein BJ742DRAFT_817913 [Cladochytrium replicatum]
MSDFGTHVSQLIEIHHREIAKSTSILTKCIAVLEAERQELQTELAKTKALVEEQKENFDLKLKNAELRVVAAIGRAEKAEASLATSGGTTSKNIAEENAKLRTTVTDLRAQNELERGRQNQRYNRLRMHFMRLEDYLEQHKAEWSKFQSPAPPSAASKRKRVEEASAGDEFQTPRDRRNETPRDELLFSGGSVDSNRQIGDGYDVQKEESGTDKIRSAQFETESAIKRRQSSPTIGEAGLTLECKQRQSARSENPFESKVQQKQPSSEKKAPSSRRLLEPSMDPTDSYVQTQDPWEPSTSTSMRRSAPPDLPSGTSSLDIQQTHPLVEIHKQVPLEAIPSGNPIRENSRVVTSGSSHEMDQGAKGPQQRPSNITSAPHANSRSVVNSSHTESCKQHETVRGNARKALPGHDCDCCKPFYEATRDFMEANNGRLLQMVSRHRAHHKRELTPPGFWQVDFPSTQEVEQQKDMARKRKSGMHVEDHIM